MNNSITHENKKYSHLSLSEREEIFAGIEQNLKHSEIAEKISRHRSTVTREVKRNFSPTARMKYSPSQAHQIYHRRLSRAHTRIHLKNKMIRRYVYYHLKKGWSPEIIAGRLPLDHPGYTTNYESIYQYIYRYKRNWIEFLARGHKKRRKRSSSYTNRSLIPDRIWIEERGEDANQRTEVGHWEADTAVTRKSSAAIQALLERKYRYCLLTKLDRKTAHNMSKAINYNLGRFPQHFKKSITYDNGSENTEHLRTNKVLNTQSFFCHPYHSWEKGSVEQLIGLLRRYIPKKTDLASISKGRLKYIEWLLNTRPRKCLGFRTPREMFFDALAP